MDSVLEVTSRNRLSEQVEFYKAGANRLLQPHTRATLGQFMTPAPVASFMASLFRETKSNVVHLLDPGAGVGSLTAAFVENLCLSNQRPELLSVTAYEIDFLLVDYLNSTLKDCRQKCEGAGIGFDFEIVQQDFIRSASEFLRHDLFSDFSRGGRFTHAILNPPYKKIRSDSEHRLLLRSAGIETSNLYSAFVALAIKMLEPDGELVAIVPRSFCNGPYFKPFRKLLSKTMGIDRVHVFESRDQAFKGDDVLQENLVFHAIKGVRPPNTVLTSSAGPDFSDMTIFKV
jgi:adenine-specific DNA-methyltransferase